MFIMIPQPPSFLRYQTCRCKNGKERFFWCSDSQLRGLSLRTCWLFNSGTLPMFKFKEALILLLISDSLAACERLAGMAMSHQGLAYRPHRVLLGTESAVSPTHNATQNRTRGSFQDQADFDTNMVIILAALLCALVCALGLNSIVRCALRSSRRFPFETPEDTAVRLASTGLKKSALRRIPIAVYGSAEVNIPATDCPICLGEFVEGDKVRVLPKCHHGFHVKCIDTWLLSHSSCPTCRQSLLDQAAVSV